MEFWQGSQSHVGFFGYGGGFVPPYSFQSWIQMSPSEKQKKNKKNN
jgi:hypothetical protein